MNKFSIFPRLRLIILTIFCLTTPLWAAYVHAQQTPPDWWVDIENDRAAKIRTELAQGADPNAQASNGQPSLLRAVATSSWKTFDVLLADPRTNVNIENPVGETPLMYVAITGDIARAQALLARGALVNKLGWTPLHYAASKGQLEMAKLLLAHDAMPNAPTPDGVTPLMMAAYADSRPVVQLLLTAGANPLAQDEKKHDAADWAEQGKAFTLSQDLRTLVSQRLQFRQKTGQDTPNQALPGQVSAPKTAPPADTSKTKPQQTPDKKNTGENTQNVQGVSNVHLNDY